MKKYIISISLMAIITGALLISCQKEAVLETVQQTKSADQLLEERILGFEKITANPLKSGETIELDSALWYAEALLNYSNSEPYDYLGAIAFTTDSISFQCNGSQLTQTEVADIYALLNQSVSSAASDENIFVFADVELLENQLKNDEVQVIIRSGFSNRDPRYAQLDDWWWAFDGLGKCGDYSGDTGKDATDIIELLLQVRIGESSASYFTGLEPHNNLSISSTSSLWGGNENSCLSPLEINYFATVGVEIVTETKATYCPTKTVISSEVHTELVTGSYSHLHVLDLTFGTPHTIVINPED